jgi:hypothetical protein
MVAIGIASFVCTWRPYAGGSTGHDPAATSIRRVPAPATRGCPLAVISLALRFRRSQGEERQQIKRLAYLGAVLAAIPLLGIAVGLIRIALGVHVSDEDLFTAILFVAFVVLLILGIPLRAASRS